MADGSDFLQAEIRRSHRERDEHYRAVVAVLNPRWHVIECCGGIQWILQRRDGERAGGPRWTGVSYFRTRGALVRTCRQKCEQCDRYAIATLEALPENFSGGR